MKQKKSTNIIKKQNCVNNTQIRKQINNRIIQLTIYLL